MNPRAHQFGAEEIDLRDVVFTPVLLSLVPADFARQHQVLPVADLGDTLKLAMSDPADLDAIDTLHHRLDRPICVCVAEDEQVREFIRRLYP